MKKRWGECVWVWVPPHVQNKECRWCCCVIVGTVFVCCCLCCCCLLLSVLCPSTRRSIDRVHREMWREREVDTKKTVCLYTKKIKHNKLLMADLPLRVLGRVPGRVLFARISVSSALAAAGGGRRWGLRVVMLLRAMPTRHWRTRRGRCRCCGRRPGKVDHTVHETCIVLPVIVFRHIARLSRQCVDEAMKIVCHIWIARRVEWVSKIVC